MYILSKGCNMKVRREELKWAKNIARNYRKDVDTDVYSQLIDACNELKLNKVDMDRRWQYACDGDLRKTTGVYSILTNETYGRKELFWT